MPSALNRLNISPTNRCHPERWVLLGVNAARRAGKQASFTLNLNHSLLKRCRVIVNLPSRASACGPRGGRRRASIAMAGLLARLRECSLLCTRDNHPDRGSRRSGRNVARLSSSKTKLPLGPMANVLRIRSLASHVTVQIWRHSPSTKRMTVPLGSPAESGGPGAWAPGGPSLPFSS